MKKSRALFSIRKIAYFLIAASIVLLFLNLRDFNFVDLKQNRYSGIASNLLLILAMTLTLVNKKKTEKYPNK